VPGGGAGKDSPCSEPPCHFLADLRAAGRSPHTVRGYRRDLVELTQHHGAVAGARRRPTLAVTAVGVRSVGG